MPTQRLLRPAQWTRWNYLLLAPAIAGMVLAVYLPLSLIGEMSLGPVQPGALFSEIIADPLYRTALFTTLEISAYVTVAALIFGLVVALLAIHASPRVEALIMILVVSSWWMSVLLRSFTWMVLLRGNGPISTLLQAVGLVNAGDSILFTKFAVIIAMTHVLTPMSILIFWLILRPRARELRQIAHSLGASDFFYFVQIILRQIGTPALAAGALVFLLATGFYITPELMGGGNGSTLMLGVLIEEQIDRFGNWQKAATVSLLLVGAVAGIIALLLAVGRNRILSAGWRSK